MLRRQGNRIAWMRAWWRKARCGLIDRIGMSKANQAIDCDRVGDAFLFLYNSFMEWGHAENNGHAAIDSRRQGAC